MYPKYMHTRFIVHFTGFLYKSPEYFLTTTCVDFTKFINAPLGFYLYLIFFLALGSRRILTSGNVKHNEHSHCMWCEQRTTADIYVRHPNVM